MKAEKQSAPAWARTQAARADQEVARLLEYIARHPAQGIPIVKELGGGYCWKLDDTRWITYQLTDAGVTVTGVHWPSDRPLHVPRRGEVAGVVLAAGHRVVRGVPSVVASSGGEPAVVGVIRNLRAAGLDHVIVVTGYRSDIVEEAIVDCLGSDEASESWLQLVENKNHALGLHSSLRVGLRLLPPCCDGVLMAFGDQPEVTPAVLRSLTSCFENGSRIVAPSFRGKRGHPLLFGREFLHHSFSDRRHGPSNLLHRFRDSVNEIEVQDQSILRSAS